MSAWRAAATFRAGLGESQLHCLAAAWNRQVGYQVSLSIGYPCSETRNGPLNNPFQEVYHVADIIISMCIVGAVMFAPMVATLFMPAGRGRTTVTSQDD